MPRPGLFDEPHPPRKGPQKASLTPEQVAKAVTDKRPSPVGQPTKVEISLRLVLSRAALERWPSPPRRGRRDRG